MLVGTIANYNYGMLANDHIVLLARAYAKRRGLAISSVSLAAAKQGLLVNRLINGKDITVGRARRIIQWFADNWPADLHWPTDIPRPEPAPDSPAARPAAARDVDADPLETVRMWLRRKSAELDDVDAIDWDRVEQAAAEALAAGSAVGPDGTLVCPEALCLALDIPRHTLDDVVRRYGHGRATGKYPRKGTGAWRAWLALRNAGDVRFRAPAA